MTARAKSKSSQLIAALMMYPTFSEACAKAGVSERTAQRWMNDGEFQRHFEWTRKEVLRKTIDGLRSCGLSSIKALQTVLDDKSVAPYVKVNAANTCLTHLFRAVEIEELSARLEKLEKALAGEGENG